MGHDEFAQAQAMRFGLFVSALACERSTLLASHAQANQHAVLTRALQFRNTFVTDLMRDMSEFWEGRLSEASDEFKTRGLARFETAGHELQDIVNQVVLREQRHSMVGQPKLIDVMRGSSGAVGLLAQRLMSRPTAKVNDKSGRQWDAEKLFHVIARDFAYQTHVDHQFDQAQAAGQTVVTTSNGEDIDLASDGWLAKRDELFHINSKEVLQ